jgi:hypothetical protein
MFHMLYIFVSVFSCMFQAFCKKNVSSVSDVCCNKCFIYMLHMFHTHVTSVLSRSCICFTHMLQQWPCSAGWLPASQQCFSLTPIQHQPTATSQPAVFFSHNKSAPAISHQRAEQGQYVSTVSNECCIHYFMLQVFHGGTMNDLRTAGDGRTRA